ncbi:putative succinate dehydrogenase/fumarate reductase, flavoprotein subunit [metagenome]|uniref:Putative succinate dehydrogenase/fumarate reductase, flavoprotein subunit n=1 Tax=metagenome TaxID=256318 RepID=A0A2P2C8V5_9ZZZZ
MTDNYDVIVIGAGNAAMSAAHAALDNGARVCIVEKAPREDRGGNSMFTGHMRFAYENLDELFAVMRPDTLTDEVRQRFAERLPRKSQDSLWDDIMDVTEGLTDPDMLKVHVEESYNTIAWLHSKGHNFAPSGDAPTGDGNLTRIDGGGEALQERNFAYMEDHAEVTILYGTAATKLLQDNTGRVTGVQVFSETGFQEITGGAVVLAAGGFEANAEMRARYLGKNWDSVHIRGVHYNTGDGLRMALEIGAQPFGGWSSAHAAPVDFGIPTSTSLSAKRRPDAKWMRTSGQSRYVYPYAIMVNMEGKRFIDEAKSTRDQTYASIGRAVLDQPGGTAFQIIDAKVREKDLVPPRYEGASGCKADTLEKLAEKMDIDVEAFVATVAEYNAAVPTDRQAVPSAYAVDGVGTTGITPPKSNYAMTIDQGPFEAFQVRCGLTFTFGGLRIEPESAQVQHVAGRPIPGLFAAGELVGGLFYWNYPSGSGLMAGATFGRIAGDSASKFATGR